MNTNSHESGNTNKTNDNEFNEFGDTNGANKNEFDKNLQTAESSAAGGEILPERRPHPLRLPASYSNRGEGKTRLD